MIEQSKLYGIIIWYYPSLENVDNINSYIQNINQLIVIDNSDIDNSILLAGFDHSKIIYVANKGNRGIATALNQGCKLAIESGAEWILTLDQDSCFFEKNLPFFIQNSNEYPDFEKVAIFSPVHFDSRNNKPKPIFDNKYSPINYTMTSGNLISIEKIQKVGLFLEDLFIDWVDEEICLRICKMNLQIVRINTVFLEHFVGNGTRKTKVLGFTKYIDDYNPIRFYYITRNVFIVSKLYPSEARRLQKRWKRLVRKTIIYDNQDKLLKIKYIIHGILDYQSGKTGLYRRKKIIK